MLSGQTPATCVSINRVRPVTWVRMVGGQWLLVACCNASVSSIALWSIPTLLACLDDTQQNPQADAFLGGPVSHGEVDVVEGRLIIAIEIRALSPWTEILSVALEDGEPVFVRLASLPGVSRLRCLKGNHLGFALYNEVSIPCLVDWERNQVVKILQRPDRRGGCIAMAVKDDLYALVSPGQLAMYRINWASSPPSVTFVHRSTLQNPVSYALVSFASENLSYPGDNTPSTIATVHICTTSDRKIAVYEVEVPIPSQSESALSSSPDSDAHVREVWAHETTAGSLVYKPAFGTKTTNISWFRLTESTAGEPVAFVTSKSPETWFPSESGRHTGTPPTPNTSTQDLYRLASLDMPALYCMGVRNYDEINGLLALGNAFGELALYDIGGYSVDLLANDTIRLPVLESEEKLPLKPIPVHTAPPYPYGSWEWISEELRETMFAWWSNKLPSHAPNGWSKDFFNNGTPKWLWYEFIPHPTSEALLLEHADHLLGTPVPLLHMPDTDTVIAEVGGLLCVYFEEYSQWRVVDSKLHGPDGSGSEYTLEEVANTLLKEGMHPGIEGLFTPRLDRCDTGRCELAQFTEMWKWEWIVHKRNRWQELADRGGEVHRGWIDKKPRTYCFLV